LNWKYQRFNAIKLNDGRVGCSMSHLKLLEMAKENNMEYIVIVEDDIMFTKPEQYKELLDGFNSLNLNYDVLLLAGNLRPPFKKINSNLMQVSKSWTTTGYIVKKHYYDKLIANIREGITKLMSNPSQHHLYAIDSYWQKLQEKDNWFILMPRTITQRPNYSSIEKRFTDYNHLMVD
jgi:glycosyl transferase family 25